MNVDRETLVNVSMLAVIVVLFLIASLLLPSFFLPYIGMPIAAAVYAFLFLRSSPLGTVQASPEAALARAAHELRLAGLVVAEGRGELTVGIGSVSAIKILARAREDGTRISFRPDATTTGWSVLLILIIAIWTSLAGAAVAIYLFLRARAFARARVAPLLGRGAERAEVPSRDDVSVMLVDGLAEGYRLAQEAFESERDRYQGNQALVLLGGLMVWFVLFLLLPFSLSETDFMQRLLTSFIWSSVVAAAVTAPAAWLVRRRFRDRLRKPRAWADRLRAAWRREAVRAPPEAGAASSFELLMEASREIPYWIESTRRAGLSRDPASWMLVLSMLIIGTDVVYGFAPSLAAYDLLVGILVGLAGVGLLVGAYAYYRRWRLRRETELARTLAEWDRRVKGLQSRMEGFLQDL